VFVDAISRRSVSVSDVELPPTDKYDAEGHPLPPGRASEAPPLALEGGRLGRFEVLERLGGGGMGDVYRAYDTDLTRTVAIKVLGARYTSDPMSKRRFLREAQLASILNHPNIATIYEIGELGGAPYIVMEYVEGTTLAERLQRGGALQIRDVVEIGSQVASALEEAHEKGVVHRDIKSGNIIQTPKGGVKILDFGLAKPSPLASKMREDVADLTEPGVLIGTITYMSPEQASGEGEVTHLSDIFSLGIVLYELTTGRLPFDGETYFKIIEKITRQPPQAVAALRPDAPPALVRVVERALAKRPEDRYESAGALQRDLRAAV